MWRSRLLENVSEIKRISRLNSKQPVNKSKKSKSKQLVVKVQKKCAVITSLIEKKCCLRKYNAMRHSYMKIIFMFGNI